MSLPVLEQKEVTNFNGDKAIWEIRHIWGQFKGLCEEPSLMAVPSTAAGSQTL